jgi:hypothetical protein
MLVSVQEKFFFLVHPKEGPAKGGYSYIEIMGDFIRHANYVRIKEVLLHFQKSKSKEAFFEPHRCLFQYISLLLINIYELQIT